MSAPKLAPAQRRCFMCTKKLGTTYGSYDGQNFCLPCHGRVMGFVCRATEPLVGILREVEHVPSDDLGPPGGACPICGSVGEDRNPAHPTPAEPHEHDCPLAEAIGAARYEACGECVVGASFDERCPRCKGRGVTGVITPAGRAALEGGGK